MTEWFLSICTAGFIMCGQVIEQTYPTEQACYRAMDELYKRQGREYFRWVTCSQSKYKRADTKEKNT